MTESLVSIVCDVETYTGGAHESSVPESWNFAVDGDEVRSIGLDDLFLDAKLGRSLVSDACVAALRARGARWVTASSCSR